MSVFLQQFLQEKKYIFLSITIVFLVGFFYGLYEYSFCNETIKNYLQNLFYFNHEKYTNHYQMYLIQNGLFIILSTYLSTSYLGHIGILFMSFLKSIQISFSMIYVFEMISIDFIILFFMIIEILIELSFLYIMSYMCIYLSTNVSLISFFMEENLHVKNTINYRLNILIYSLLVFSLSLALRIYIVPLF